VAVIGYFFTPHILDAMQTPPDAKAEAIIYLRLIFLSMPFLSLFLFAQMTQRGAGDARTPLYFSMLGVGLDIILNPLLIAGVGPFPKLGIAGSALSTMIAQFIAAVSLFFYLYRTGSPLALHREEWRLVRFDPQIMRSLVTRGLPMGAQMLVISGAAIVMMSLVNRYGVQTSAAYGAATVLWTYVQMPAMAVGASVSSMAAQNVGAQRWDRVNLIAREGVIFGVVWTGAPVALIYLFNSQVLQLFLPAGTPALAIAERINHFALWSFMILSVTFVFTSIVRATGAVLAPLVLLFVSMWLVRVPLAAFASQYYGADAVWLSFPVSSAVSAVLAYLYYRHGDWRSARMMAGTPAKS
jgi:putative MATE family efflux protein